MNRRTLLTSLATLGIVLAAPKVKAARTLEEKARTCVGIARQILARNVEDKVVEDTAYSLMFVKHETLEEYKLFLDHGVGRTPKCFHCSRRSSLVAIGRRGYPFRCTTHLPDEVFTPAAP